MGLDIAGVGDFAASAKEPVLKLIDVISSGIGKLYKPIDIVRMANAHAKEIDILSSAIQRNIDLPIAFSKEGVEINAKSGEELAQRAKNRLIYQEIQKQLNVEMVIHNAYDVIKEEKNVSKEPVDKDWTTRFFNIAGDVRNEDMQVLWGRILAGEIKQPGNYSLRTLELLRNLSKKEAEIFCKVINYVINNDKQYFIINDDEIIKKANISFDELLLLEQAGLLNAHALAISIEVKENDDTEFLVYQNKKMILEVGNNPKEMVNFSCYALTVCGSEIYSITEKYFIENYFKYVITQLEKQKLKVSVISN